MYGQSDTGDITGPHRAERAVANAWKWEVSPMSCLLSYFPRTTLIACPKKAQLRKPKIDRKEQSGSQ